MAFNSQFSIWLDVNGNKRTTYYRFQPAAFAIDTAMQIYSNTRIMERVTALAQTAIVAPVNAQFKSDADEMDLVFQTAFGNNVTLSVPAPLVANFFGDQYTVNPFAIPLLINACVPNLTDAAGNVCIAFISGVRRRRGIQNVSP